MRFLKKIEMAVKLKIGTHNGSFHCDEALACFMIKLLHGDIDIVRSRDQNVLSTCDMVVDVGSVYDPSKNLFDHHQQTFNESMGSLRPGFPSDIKLSSAGLIYHHFGEKVIETVCGEKLEPKIMSHMFKFVYNNIIKEVDGIDNGVPMFDEGEPRYNIRTSLSSRVEKLMPSWNNKEAVSFDELFVKAMELAGREFVETVNRCHEVWWPARKLVEEAINNRFNVHESGAIIEIGFCPWREHLFELEEDQEIEGSIKYVIFEDSPTWRVVCVPVKPSSFVLRVPLLETYRGLRNEELISKSSIPDAVFVHANGFIGGAGSRNGALALAVNTLDALK